MIEPQPFPCAPACGYGCDLPDEEVQQQNRYDRAEKQCRRFEPVSCIKKKSNQKQKTKKTKKRRKRLFTPSHEKLQHLTTTSNTSLETDAFK